MSTGLENQAHGVEQKTIDKPLSFKENRVYFSTNRVNQFAKKAFELPSGALNKALANKNQTKDAKPKRSKKKIVNTKKVRSFNQKKKEKNPLKKLENNKKSVHKKGKARDKESLANKNGQVQQVGATGSKKESCTIELVINEIISASTLDILERAMERVKKEFCQSLLLLINTPGGILQTTRKIVDRILNAPFPVLCFIYPAGAQAASAGAIIMQACHVNGGLRSTNIGAATPVIGQNKEMAKDMRNKVVNDTTAWLDSLTKLRGRSQKFGKEIVTEAKSLSAEDALKENGIDFVGATKEEFLQFASGREVLVEHEKKHKVVVGKIISYQLGFRHKITSLLTNPSLIYILFMGSLLLIYFEITHPGFGAPGLLGIVGLIVSFVGMDMLNFSLGGLALLLLSFILFLVEVFVAGYGIFGVMGIVSLLLGSFLLFDPSQTGGVDISIQLILLVSLVFFLVVLILSYLTIKTWKLKKPTLGEEFVAGESLPALVTKLEDEGRSGYLTYKGENWKFQLDLSSTDHRFQVGEKVEIVRQKGMLMCIKPLKQE